MLEDDVCLRCSYKNDKKAGSDVTRPAFSADRLAAALMNVKNTVERAKGVLYQIGAWQVLRP
jgi:hypothetical protein